MKIFYGILVLLVTLVAAAIAIANRGVVALKFDPLPYQIEVPLFLLLFITLFLGALIGAAAMWLRDGKVRKRARAEHRESVRLQRELKVLEPKASGSSS